MVTKSKWEHVAVLGAAGKMGSGISLLLLQEMADMEGGCLTLLDANSDGFEALKTYLREHLVKYAERNINRLREKYADRPHLIDNGEIIEEYVRHAMNQVRCVTALEECRGAHLIFEAIVEDVEIKAQIFRKIEACGNHEAFYFTNTSSIPLAVLQEKSQLGGRLIGFHFYNPPAIQKLVEIVLPQKIDLKLREFAIALSKHLKKTVVFSNDVAGFIGNGHFIREIMFSCQAVGELSQNMTQTEAIEVVNYVTQDFLLRPMGIFQLIDYVGIDVCQRIGKIMTTYLPGKSFIDPLIDAMVAVGVIGGQHPDGSQQPGFLRYEKGHPTAVYDLKLRKYVPYNLSKINHLPAKHVSWKILSKDPKRQNKIEQYFSSLKHEESLSAQLSRDFLKNSQLIAEGLVKDGIASSIEDVDAVLQQGFYHLYGVNAPFAALEPAGGKR